MNIQKQPQEVFYKENALKNFPVIFTKILRTNFLENIIWMTASECWHLSSQQIKGTVIQVI